MSLRSVFRNIPMVQLLLIKPAVKTVYIKEKKLLTV